MLLLGVGLEVLGVIHGRVNAGLSCRIELARTFFLVFFFSTLLFGGGSFRPFLGVFLFETVILGRILY